MKDIVVNNIYKSYGEKKPLNGFSATFPAGKCTCIMGESGRGKTTLLRLITGLEKPDSGNIEGIPERISVVFQEDRLCESFSVEANIKMVLDEKRMTEDEKNHICEELRNIPAELNLTEDMNTKVSLLSGGMKRRVAIARALMFESDWIILDEPFKGLDKDTRACVIEAIKRRRSSIIMVSHDPEEAELMGAEIIRMK